MKKCVISIVMLLAVTVPGVASAWDNEFHVQMVKDAVALCPVELKKFLKENIDAVLYGAQDPDNTITTPIGYAYGYRKHYYIPEGDKGEAPDEVRTLALSVIDLISQNSPDTQLIGRRLGMVSHFVADALEPRRYIGLAPNYPKDFVPEQFRTKDVTYFPVIYNGYTPVIDFSGDLKALARNLWYQNPTDERYYDMAVNFIVDTWITIWERAGKPSGEMVATGSRIRPEIPKHETAPTAIFSPSNVLDLKGLGEAPGPATYDEKSFDLEKYGKTKTMTPEATGEEPLERKTPEEIEKATGTPPPPGVTTPPGGETGESPGGTPGETPEEKTGPSTTL
jgi:hypothetical protein